MNIVPPYDGWVDFEMFLIRMIDGLFENYPDSTNSLFVEKLLLRYIDGFDDQFGFNRYSEFAENMLGIQPPLPRAFLNECAEEQTDISFVIDVQFKNLLPVGSFGRVIVAPGTSMDKSALIMEMHCESLWPQKNSISEKDVKKWFNEAHQSLHSQFDKLATRALKAEFGEKSRFQNEFRRSRNYPDGPTCQEESSR